MSITPKSPTDDSDHEVELITQPPLEKIEDIQPTPMELETNLLKRKVPTAF